MRRLLFGLGVALIGANAAEAAWGLAPPPYIPIFNAITVSVAPGHWKVTTSNVKLQVAWFQDPTGKWHSQKIASFGSSESGKDDVSLTSLNFFTIPGVWTGEVVVQTYPIGANPPTYLYEIVAAPTLVLVGEPNVTPTPTPSPTPTPTPSPTPTPTPTIPTPTPTPTPKDKLFK